MALGGLEHTTVFSCFWFHPGYDICRKTVWRYSSSVPACNPLRWITGTVPNTACYKYESNQLGSHCRLLQVQQHLTRLQLQAQISAAVFVFAETSLGLAGTGRRRVTGQSHTCEPQSFLLALSQNLGLAKYCRWSRQRLELRINSE